MISEKRVSTIARVLPHSLGRASIREQGKLVDERLRITDRKEIAVVSRQGHFRRAADIGMNHRPAQGHAMASIAARENASVTLHNATTSQAAI